MQRFFAANPEQVVAIARILYPECEDGPVSEGEKREMGGPRFLFRLAGSHCDVVFHGSEEFHVRNNLAASTSATCCTIQTRSSRRMTWRWRSGRKRAGVRSRGSIQQKLGAKTAKEYLRELEVLRHQREEAQERGDSAEVDRLDGEIGAYEEAIEGEGVTGDAGERARCNVSKAIAALRRELAGRGPAERAFCRHMEQFVSLGYECVYNQPEGRVWG